jgi:hypothetical protein
MRIGISGPKRDCAAHFWFCFARATRLQQGDCFAQKSDVTGLTRLAPLPSREQSDWLSADHSRRAAERGETGKRNA